jgi:DNA-directed RNA polymerase II subunit RPB1
VTNSQIGKLEQ